MPRSNIRRILRDGLLTGVAILIVHSYFTVSMFRAIYADRGRAQAEMAWIIFNEIDDPAVPLAFEWLGQTRPMQVIFDWGYDLAGSGPNLRAFVLVSLAGGLQWFFIGCGLGGCLSVIEGVSKSRLLRRGGKAIPSPSGLASCGWLL